MRFFQLISLFVFFEPEPEPEPEPDAFRLPSTNRVQQQNLRLRAALPFPEQPRRKNPRLVQNERVTSRNQLQQISKDAVLDGAGVPAHEQETAFITTGSRMMGDEA